MSLFTSFVKEKCPRCGSILVAKVSVDSKSITIKMCPKKHYQKEFHPALETYIESNKIS